MYVHFSRFLKYYFELVRHGAEVPEGGIGTFSAHGFRRTSITNQLGEGINGASVALTSGHRSAEGMQSYVSSTGASRLRSTAAAFGAVQPEGPHQDEPQERSTKRVRLESSSPSSSSSSTSPSSTSTFPVGFPPTAYPFPAFFAAPSAITSAEDSFRARVKKLKKLLKKKFINEEEFAAARQKAFKETIGR